MRIGSTLNIHRRAADGSPGELLGQARIIHPQAAQALPPFDHVLRTTRHRSADLIAVPVSDDEAPGKSDVPDKSDLPRGKGLTGEVKPAENRLAASKPKVPIEKGTPKDKDVPPDKGAESFPISRIRPGLVGFHEARQIVQKECPGLELAETPNGLVAFEFDQPIVADTLMMARSSWWCKILCLSSCGHC